MESEKKLWVPFIADDLEWLDTMLRCEYNSFPQGIDGDVLRKAAIERCMRLNRNKVIDELLAN